MEKPPKRRILIVNSSNEGTIAMCTLNLWKALSEDSGSEVKCIIKHRFPAGLPEFDNCDFYSDSPPPGGLKNLTSMLSQIRWLRRQKKTFKPDLTISACASCSALNILAGGKDRKIGIFHSPHRQARSLGRVPYLYMLAYFNFLFPFLDRLFCVSEGVKDSILQSLRQINPAKISVVYNAHDIGRIRSLALEEIKDPAEKYIFSKPVYIYVGRFDANKAPERAVRALAEAFPGGDEQLVFIGGDAQYSEKVRAIAVECKVSNRVHLLGQKVNPCMYVARSKALVSCSFSEGLPGVIIEATALGIPVISTNSSKGVWEIMDCLNDYQAQMHGNHHTAYGTITPNNLPETENLRFLASAMKRPISTPTPDNPFIQKVTYPSIRQIYINA